MRKSSLYELGYAFVAIVILMKLAVIAANGKTGKMFVERALAAGHSVHAGVFNTNKLSSHENLSVIHCDATNKEDLLQLISNQDAVASFIGHVKGSPPNVQTDTMQALVEVMKQQNIKRVVSLTGTGVRFPSDRITIMDRVLNWGIGFIDPARVRDGINHVDVLRNSDLDWTVLRVLKLQDTTPKSFILRDNGPTKLYVSRQEVAEAALQVIENGTFIKQAPILSYP